MCSLLEFAIHDVREDLKLSVRVRPKARLRRNAVLVDDLEGAELAMRSLMIAEDDLQTERAFEIEVCLTRQRRTCGRS
jgi:hypothetical protein